MKEKEYNKIEERIIHLMAKSESYGLTNEEIAELKYLGAKVRLEVELRP